MKSMKMCRISVSTLALAGILATAAAFADKPAHAGGGKETKQLKHEGRPGSAASRPQRDNRSAHDSRPMAGRYFDERHRAAVVNYYDEQFRRDRCPPGLAKKNNGCMPPGLAKRWAIGQPLARDVIFYDVSPEIISVLGVPPAGHRYVRVARDILLITIGTGMVLDGIEGLSGS